MPSPGRAALPHPLVLGNFGVPAWQVPGRAQHLLATSGPGLRWEMGHPHWVLSHRWKPWGIGGPSSPPWPVISSLQVPPLSVRTLTRLSFPSTTSHHTGPRSLFCCLDPCLTPPASLCLSVCPPQVWGCVFCTPHAPPSLLRSGPSSQFLAWRLPELTPASPGGLSPDTQLAASCCVPLLVGLLLAGTSSYSMIGCCSSRLSSDVASCRMLSRMTVLSPRLQLN